MTNAHQSSYGFLKLGVGLLLAITGMASVARADYITATATNSSNQPASFNITAQGSGSYGFYQIYIYDVTSSSGPPAGTQVNVFPDTSLGSYVGAVYVAWSASNVITRSWTDPRGLVGNGTRTYQFVGEELYSNIYSGGWAYFSSTATTAINGPTGNMTAVANATSGPLNVNLTVNNQNFGSGINRVTISDPFRGTYDITPTPNPVTGSSTFNFTDSGTNEGTRTVSFQAKGTVSGQPYQLPTVAISVTSAVLSLSSATGSTNLNAPAQPRVNIFAPQMISTNGDGSSQADLIYYVYGMYNGGGWNNISSPTTYGTWSGSWADPRGNLGAGTYTYTIKTVGYRWDPQSQDNYDDDGNYTGTDYWFNQNWYDPLHQATITFTLVSGSPQTITFANPTTHNLNDVFTLGASASSGLAVTYSVVSGIGTITGSGSSATFTATNAGSVTVRASQGGQTSVWLPATDVDRTFTVNTASQTISFPNPGTHTYGDAGFILTGSASSGLPITYSVASGPATISGSTLTITGAGTVVVNANQSGNANYTAAAQVQQSFVVNKANQSVAFAPIVDKSYASAPFAVSASASTGLALTFSITGPATMSGPTVTMSGGTGLVTITATQVGNANYNSASATQTFNATAQPVVTSAATAVGTVNTAFTYTITGAPNAAIFSVVGTLPAGLTVNSATGLISGTPTQQGIFPLTMNVGNAYGVSSGPLTITIRADSTWGRAFGGSASNTSNQPASFSLSLNWGTYTQGGYNYYTVQDTGTGQTFGAYSLPNAGGVSGGVSTFSWSDPRGFNFNGTRTFNFVAYPNSGSNGTLVASLSTYVSGPTGQLAVVQTNPGAAGAPTFSLLINNNNFGGGIFSISFSGPGGGGSTGTSLITGSGTVTFQSPWPYYSGNQTYTFTASGSGYSLPSVSVVANNTAIGWSQITLTPLNGSLLPNGQRQLNAPAQANIGISAVPSVSTNGDGSSQTDQIYYVYAMCSADGAWRSVASPFTQSTWTGSWTDPVARGVGNYTFYVKTVGYRWDPQSQDNYDDSGNYTGADYWYNQNWYDPLDQATIGYAVVSGAAQSITFPAPSVHYVGDSPFSLSATASSGLAVTLTQTSGAGTVANLSGTTVTMLGIGSAVVQASQAGNGTYAPAPTVLQGIFILRAPQTITFTNPGTKNTGTVLNLASYASASSGLPLSYVVTQGNANVSGQNLTVNAPGAVSVTAYQTGNSNYAGANPVSVSFTVVNGLPQTITFPAIPNHTYLDAPISLGASSDSGLPITYTVTSGPATVSGSTLTITGAGSVVVQANQPGNATYNPASPVSQSFTVAKANQTITFPSIPPHTFLDANFSLSATADSGLTPTFTIASGPATISGNVLSITGAGTVTVNANQAGNANFNAAAQVQQSFVVNKANQTITFPTIVDKSYANPPFTITATASSGLTPVTFSVTSGPATAGGTNGSTITMSGSTGVVTIQAAQAGNANYNPATISQSFTATNQPAITNALAISGTVGTPLSVTLAGAPNLSTLTVNGALPPGLSFNPTTFVISGTPSLVGVYTVTENAGNTYGVTSLPLTFTITSNGGMWISAVPTNTPSQTPAFTVTVNYAGRGTVNYTGNWVSISDLTDGTNFGGVNLPFSLSTSTINWSDPRGITYNGTHTYRFTYSILNGSWLMDSTNANDFITGPTGYIVATATNASNTPASFNIAIVNNGYSTGITRVDLYDTSTGLGPSTTPSPNPVLNNGVATYVDSQNYSGSHVWTITAYGAGYRLPPVSVSASSNNPSGSRITLTSGTGSLYLASGSRPSINVTASPSTSYNGDGSSQTDQIYYLYAMCSADGIWRNFASPFTQSAWSGNFTDPITRATGTYTYYVKTVGYRWDPQSQDNYDDSGNYTGTDYWYNQTWYDPLDQNTITFVVQSGTTQSISFSNPGTHVVTDAPFALSATATSGLPISFSVVSGPATVSGSTLTITGVGAVVLQAAQSGNGTYQSAPPVQQTFAVAKATQTLSFSNPGNQTVGSTLNLASYATATSGLVPTFVLSSGLATLSGTNLTINGGGPITVYAFQTGNGTYLAAPPVSTTFTALNGQPQTITFPNPGTHTYGDAPFALTASSTSGLPITYTVTSGPATVSGSTLTLTNGGTNVTVVASQVGNSTFNPANPVTQTFMVKLNQTITFPAPLDKSTGSPPFTVTTSASSGLGPTLTIVSGPATVSGSTITLTGVSGTVVVQADQAGNSIYNPAPSVQRSFNVLPVPVLTSSASVSGTVGTAFSYTPTTSPAATSFSFTGTVPPGLSINSTTGVISGTPTQMGVFNLLLNTGNNVGIFTNPFTISISSSLGIVVGAVATNPTSQPASFTITYNDNFFGRAYVGANYYGLYSIQIQDQNTGQVLDTRYVAWTADNANHTINWTDPRGFAFTGSHTFLFTATAYNSSGQPQSPQTASATATVMAPGYIVPVQTNVPQTGNPAFAITVFNNNYSTGITAILVSGPAGSSSTSVGTITGTGTANWTSPWPNPGTYTFTAVGSGYFLPPVSVNAVNTSYSGGGIQLSSATGSLTLSAAARPAINIVATPSTSYNGDGSSQTDQIYYLYAMCSADGFWRNFASPFTQSQWSGSFTDPTSRGAGTYSYYVKTVGYRWDPQSQDNYDDSGNYTGTDYWYNQNWYDPLDQSTITFTVVNGVQQTITFTNPGSHQFGDAPFGLSASASSGLPLTFTVVSGPATLSGSTVTLTGVGTVAVRADQAGNGTYAAAANTQFFVVGKAGQTITFPAPGNIIAGTSQTLSATSSSGLSVTYSVVSGPATVSGNTVTATGSGSITIQADQAGNGTYLNAAPVQQSFVAYNGQPQTISFGGIPNHTYLDSPFTVSASASSGLPVSFSIASGPATISGSTVTITGAGTVTVQATQGGNATWLPATPVNQSFTVAQAAQSISFPALANHVYGDAPFNATATATSGLAVSYSIVSGPATVSGSTITITGTGSVVVRANQSGNGNYLAASAVNQSFSVSVASQTISFGIIPTHFYGDVFTLGGTASSTLPVAYAVSSGPATVVGNSLTVTGIGTVTVVASQAGNSNYTAAGNVTQSFSTVPANQTISFGPIPAHNYADVFTLGATASSTLPVSYTVTSGPATVTGNSVTITGIGSVTILASQAGNTNYNAAAGVSQTFSAGQATQTTSFGGIPAHLYGDVFTVAATASSGLPVSFAVASGPASIAGNTVTITGVGSVTITATQAGNANYAAAPAVNQSFATNKANQTITFGALANHTFNDAPFTVSATASSGLPVTFAVTAGPATISGATVTITGGGTVTITASQAGNANYNAATNVPQSFNVATAAQTISFGALAGRNYGDAAFSLSASATSGLPVSFSIVSGPATVTAGTLSITGAGNVTMQASQAGNSNYGAASPVNQSFTVAKVTPTGTWAGRSITTPSATYSVVAGDLNAAFIHPFNTSTTTPPSGAVSYSIVGPGTAVTAGTALNVNTVYTIRASYPGDTNYNPTTADAVFTIVPPPPVVGSANSVNAVANQAFSFQANATFSPTSWSATGLPTGFTINNAGLISGTTNQTGTFNVTLTANNAGGSGTQSLTLNVYLQPSISSSLSPVIKLNVSFSYTIVASGNPTVFTASGLPPGLTLNASSGVISGTPTTVANYPVNITAANPGASTPATLNLNVAQTYTLTIVGSPGVGGSTSGAGVFDPGTSAPINAVPAALYRFGSWGGADGAAVANSANASSSIVMSANRSLQANFIAQANVTVNAGAGGTVTGTGAYDIGSNAPITATPSAGNYFTGWTGVGVSNPLAASTSVNVPGAVTVTANFATLGSVMSLGTITFGNAVPTGQSGVSATTSAMTATVANNGSSALNVTNVTASGDFAPNVTLPFSIPAGNAVDIPVVFAPRALGARAGQFTLVSNDSSNTMLLYNLQGTGSNPNQPPTVTLSSPAAAYSGSPMTVSSVATAPNNNLTLHSIESMSPSGSWTVNVVAASGGSSSRTVGVVFPSVGAWTVRAGASTDGGVTWTYSSSVVVSVSNGLIPYDVQTMAVPNANMQMWFVPSPVVEKQFQVQRTNP